MSAHDELISSSPSNGDVLTSLPASIVLTFEEPPADGYTKVKVIGPAGTNTASGSPLSNGAIITQPLAAPSAAGRYTVDWSVLSDDGHPVAGSFAFTVRGTVSTVTSASAAPAATKTGGGNGLVWLVVALAGLVVIAGATAVFRKRSP